MRRCVALLATIASSLAVVACGSDESSDNSNAAATGKEKPVRVYTLLPSLQDEAYLRTRKGMETQEGKEENAEITLEAGSERGSADSLIQKIQSAVTQQYDAISINGGTNAKQLVPALTEAIDKGIKVIAFDQDLPGLEGKTTLIGWDSERAGKVMGEWWKTEGLPEGGKVGVIRCFAGTGQLLDKEFDGWNGAKGSKIQVVSTIDAECDQAKSRAAAENMLTAHPDLKGIFADTDFGALGAERALKAADKDLVLTGCCGAEAVLATIDKGGIIDATTTFPFELFGERAVQYAVQAARGKQFPEVSFITPELVTQPNAAKVLEGIQSYPGS
ncbi:MAG: sugar ABC transporter substrate-binding protein [Solirubrobacterales bacterium]|nr:sugar ABC transporter substrate-binding protein [Solirubrobacterales bacterium]